MIVTKDGIYLAAIETCYGTVLRSRADKYMRISDDGKTILAIRAYGSSADREGEIIAWLNNRGPVVNGEHIYVALKLDIQTGEVQVRSNTDKHWVTLPPGETYSFATVLRSVLASSDSLSDAFVMDCLAQVLQGASKTIKVTWSEGAITVSEFTPTVRWTVSTITEYEERKAND